LEEVGEDRRWVTFDTAQSRSLLEGEQVVFLDYAGPRDFNTLARHSLVARGLFAGRHPYSTVLSTGSGIALSFLPLARTRGAACHYIESFTRSAGPSLTGRLLSHVPGIEVYTQYPALARGRWRYGGSVFDVFRPGAEQARERQIQRAVVTLGTMEDYSFRRLVDRVLALLPSEVEVLWQVGCTDVSDLPIAARRQIPAHALQEAVSAADVLIAHAGCGSSLSALAAGKLPVLVPRSATHGENVDDHQSLLAGELSRRGLALVRSVDDLALEDLQRAARSSVRTEPCGVPFELVN
jgi:UDP-N-acetylglucosamine transferase subunit ALG13